MSLEEYDETTGKATKAAIMHADVVGRTPSITSVESAEQGLLVSLNERGTVDLPYISQLYGQPVERVIEELGDLINLDPETCTWQIGRCVPVRQRAGQAGGGRASRAGVSSQRRGASHSAAGGRAAGRHRRQPGRAVDTDRRHSGVCRRTVRRPCVRDPRRSLAERCRLVPRRRSCGRVFGRSNGRVRHVPRQWSIAAGTGAQSQDAGDLRHVRRRAHAEPGSNAGRP